MNTVCSFVIIWKLILRENPFYDKYLKQEKKVHLSFTIVIILK